MSLENFRRRWHPLQPHEQRCPTPVYEDGCYVISEAGEAATWAVCHHGSWGIVYEISGRQLLSAWVDVADIPLHVLAEALHGAER